MKFLLISIYLMSGFPLLKGTEELQHILLRFSFPSFYNSYTKFCCKCYPGGCYKLLDSAGYTCDLLRGRVTKTEVNGWIVFEISNVQPADAGYYRCGIVGAPNQIYSDYYVEVVEASDHYSRFQPAPTATIKALNSSTTIPDSTRPVQRSPWSFGLPLIAVVSVTVMTLVILATGAICYTLKAKRRKSGSCGETLSESVKQEALVGAEQGSSSLTHGQDMNGIVYTTVDFRPHQGPEEVYANLRLQKGGAEHAGKVEYSTLAVHI